MATIVVETGAQVSGANSYVSEADLTTYATDRGITITGTNAVLLIQAMDYIEQQPYKGYKLSSTQALQWPRGDVIVDGYSVDNDTIPQLLIDALCEAALGIDAGNNPLAAVEREVKKEKVGPVEVEYMDGTYSQTFVKAIDNKLQKLLKPGSGGINVTVLRA